MSKGYISAEFDFNERVRQHAPLVKRIAMQMVGRLGDHVPFDDLYQEGMTGLIDALQKYTPTPDASFETYASLRIRGAMYDACRREDWIPRYQRDKVSTIQKEILRLQHVLQRQPKEQEVADAVGMSLADYQDALNNMSHLTLIDDVPEELLPRSEAEHTQDEIFRKQVMTKLSALLPQLSGKQQMVLALHYQEDLSYRDIAKVMSLTPGRISQLHTQAMLSLRAMMDAN